jgi:hypothetical protein
VRRSGLEKNLCCWPISLAAFEIVITGINDDACSPLLEDRSNQENEVPAQRYV